MSWSVILNAPLAVYRAAGSVGRWLRGLLPASGEDVNKLFGALLVALLTMAVIDQAGTLVFGGHHGGHHGDKAAGVALDVPPDGGAPDTAMQTARAPADAAPEPVVPLLASASPENGARLSKRCTACHSFGRDGSHRAGPNLWGIVGEARGTRDGFNYSKALRTSGGTWDFETLNHFLKAPSKAVPGTRMVFAGLRKIQDRADLIAFMREQSDVPLPLPGE